jgi:cytochrome b6-f complex iron-sulfur subunit
VADILAAARANKGEAGGEAKAAVEKKPAAEKNPAADKPKPAEKAPAKEVPVGVGAGARDTASILGAARTEAKPGPMSKAEAAKLKPDAPAKEPKAKLVVPPMPVKPEYAKPKAPKGEEATDGRRFFMSTLAIGFLSMGTTFTLWTLGFARFMFPNILTEPPSRFPVGFPGDFPPGSVDEKFKATNGVWIVNTEYNGKREIVALRTVCTHLGCTPNWLDGEQKFKCPCHGSGFYKDGINFEGPAPRPLERYAISVGDDGQLVVDKSKLFLEELGQWQDPACYVPV